MFNGAPRAHPDTAYFILGAFKASTYCADETAQGWTLCEVRFGQVPFRVVFEACCTYPHVTLTAEFNACPLLVFAAFNQRDEAHKTLCAGCFVMLLVEFFKVPTADRGHSPVQVCCFSDFAHQCISTLLVTISQQTLQNLTGEAGVVINGAGTTVLPAVQGVDFGPCPCDKRHDICTRSRGFASERSDGGECEALPCSPIQL